MTERYPDLETSPQAPRLAGKRVCIVQAVMKQYRRPLYERLVPALARHGVHLTVVYSKPNARETLKGDNVELPPSYGRRVRALWMLGDRVVLQGGWCEIRRADLVIVEQATKHLLNYPLLLLSRLGLKRVGYWGHGRNMQSSRYGYSEWLKARLLRASDWWFAYTDGVARFLVERGVPPQRVTALQNSVDTSELRQALTALHTLELDRLRQDLGIVSGDRVAVFCGSLHADKRIAFLLDAACRIRQRVPNFHLVVVGGGADAEAVERLAQEHRWIHYVGPRFGPDKARYLALGELFVNPGLIGLAVLDAFTAGLPVVTTDAPVHSPEIDYVVHGQNGLVVEYDLAAYAQAVCALLDDPTRLQYLAARARESAELNSLDVMVANFCAGIRSCLSLAEDAGSGHATRLQERADPLSRK
jgi:glycosyltransferase involved in cell wall biosynthesis